MTSTNGHNGHDPDIRPPHWPSVPLTPQEPEPEKKRGLFGCGLLIVLPVAPSAWAVVDALGRWSS